MTRSPDETDRPRRPIVVCCPDFDENSGGAIVLHYLVDRLRALGMEAYARPRVKEHRRDGLSWLRDLQNWNRHRRRVRTFRTHPSMDVPVAPRTLLRDAIAVYPETMPGNPLNAPHVVRWMLNRKGFFKETAFTEDEWVVYYQEAFAGEGVDVGPQDLLQVRWLRDDVYFDRGLEQRKGACRMIRKGAATGTDTIPDDDDAILIDGMSHEEIADIFNRTERFYCHDPYTMYAYYAALCGCVPIVVPRPGLSRDDWRKGFELKFGVAYGEDEIQWAVQTRPELIAAMGEAKAKERENLVSFLRLLKERFG